MPVGHVAYIAVCPNLCFPTPGTNREQQSVSVSRRPPQPPGSTTSIRSTFRCRRDDHPRLNSLRSTSAMTSSGLSTCASDVDQERFEFQQVRASPQQMLERDLPFVFRRVQPLSVCGPDGQQRRLTRARVRMITILRPGKMLEQETFVADWLPDDRERILPGDLSSLFDLLAVSGATLGNTAELSGFSRRILIVDGPLVHPCRGRRPPPASERLRAH